MVGWTAIVRDWSWRAEENRATGLTPCLCESVCYSRPQGYRQGPQLKSCWLRFNTACLAAILLVQLAGGKSNLLSLSLLLSPFSLFPSCCVLLHVSVRPSVSLPLLLLFIPSLHSSSSPIIFCLCLFPLRFRTQSIWFNKLYWQWMRLWSRGGDYSGIKTGNTFAFNGERLINTSSTAILQMNRFLSCFRSNSVFIPTWGYSMFLFSCCNCSESDLLGNFGIQQLYWFSA